MRHALSLIAIVGVSLPLFAQQVSVAEVSFDHVAVSVEDVDRSADFYRTVVGLQEIANRTEVDGIRWFSLGEGKELHLISVLKEPVSLNKAVHFALTTSDFDSFVESLRQANIEFSNWVGDAQTITTRADGVRQIFLQDPDGFWIEVNSTASDLRASTTQTALGR
jgi:catechol 2,3-dioxygenase-like lactoylglutathione lyase family enzyme